jgi:hypothetical protein
VPRQLQSKSIYAMGVGQKVSVPLNNGLNFIYSKWVTMNEKNYTRLCNGDALKAILML